MSSKEIVALSDFEHVLERPTMYIGSVNQTEEKVPIIEDGLVYIKPKTISIGFYKLLNEVLDNAFDEAKRCKGKMKSITIEIFSKTGRVIISDTGDGFYKGYDINKKTGLTNVETAMSQLRAGSNFKNKDTEETLIGTNGVGASLVNMLSDRFEITTGDGIKKYYQKWENFISVEKKIRAIPEKGTTIDFTPRQDIFGNCIWDKDILKTSFIFRNYLKSMDSTIRNLKFVARFDNEVLDLEESFYGSSAISVESKVGNIVLWKSFENSGKISFVNGALCTGIHQKIVQDWVNDILKYKDAHDFYETFININLEPRFVVFNDQNKTKFSGTRQVIEPILEKEFKKKLKTEFTNSVLHAQIKEDIESRIKGNSAKKIVKDTKKIVISDKYFPSSKSKEMLFIVEGNSARGSILQRRDSKTMSIYTLKGKVKNVQDIETLSKNEEIIELIKIIGLDLEGQKDTKYKKIVIAVDADPDGSHISSLILNFLYKWFPYTLEQGKVFQLKTPIITGQDGKELKRFYSLEEFKKFKKPLKNLRYLKGLGSLSISDWEHVFSEMYLEQFVIDKGSKSVMDMAFGDSSKAKKDWLVG